MNNTLALTVVPLLPFSFLFLLIALCSLIIGAALWGRLKGGWLRLAGLVTVLFALFNLSLDEEQHTFLPDIVTIIVDESSSQKLGERSQRTQQALSSLRAQLNSFPNVEVSVEYKRPSQQQETEETHLFDTIHSNLLPQQHAATIILSDGQVHDVPSQTQNIQALAPVHVLLTGDREEVDRRLVVKEVPSFGIVGQTTNARLLIEDLSPTSPAQTSLTIHTINGTTTHLMVPIGKPFSIELPISHGGQNIFELSIDTDSNELTSLNNYAAVVINGIRERLQVLLISGFPHTGGRVWRNILKTEPSVDLVHFIILRSSEDDLSIPNHELSLIPFPIHELFEEKLNTFDLIILDRYQRRGFLSTKYFQNTVDYVKNGGALLESSGPSFNSPLSIFNTPLKEILPAQPTRQVLETPFRLKLTDIGRHHPVTLTLVQEESVSRQGQRTNSWGHWFRQVVVQEDKGSTVLSGAEDFPLLILDRVGEGRVAHLTSDQIWLWARGYEDGGPHTELIRRLVHWLMKEPQLEENRLHAYTTQNSLIIERHKMNPEDISVTVTAPDNTTTTIPLIDTSNSQAVARVPISQFGVYHIDDGQQTTVTAFGSLDTPEYSDMRTSQRPLQSIVQQTGGGIYWLSDFETQGGTPEVRHQQYTPLSAQNWLGIRANKAYVVSGIETFPLIPEIILLGLSILFFMTAWYREGR